MQERLASIIKGAIELLPYKAENTKNCAKLLVSMKRRERLYTIEASKIGRSIITPQEINSGELQNLLILIIQVNMAKYHGLTTPK
jgi:hypothetical protein